MDKHLSEKLSCAVDALFGCEGLNSEQLQTIRECIWQCPEKLWDVYRTRRINFELDTSVRVKSDSTVIPYMSTQDGMDAQCGHLDMHEIGYLNQSIFE